MPPERGAASASTKFACVFVELLNALCSEMCCDSENGKGHDHTIQRNNNLSKESGMLLSISAEEAVVVQDLAKFN